jgi:hypothetical protein
MLNFVSKRRNLHIVYLDNRNVHGVSSDQMSRAGFGRDQREKNPKPAVNCLGFFIYGQTTSYHPERCRSTVVGSKFIQYAKAKGVQDVGHRKIESSAPSGQNEGKSAHVSVASQEAPMSPNVTVQDDRRGNRYSAISAKAQEEASRHPRW